MYNNNLLLFESQLYSDNNVFIAEEDIPVFIKQTDDDWIDIDVNTLYDTVVTRQTKCPGLFEVTGGIQSMTRFSFGSKYDQFIRAYIPKGEIFYIDSGLNRVRSNKIFITEILSFDEAKKYCEPDYFKENVLNKLSIKTSEIIDLGLTIKENKKVSLSLEGSKISCSPGIHIYNNIYYCGVYMYSMDDINKFKHNFHVQDDREPNYVSLLNYDIGGTYYTKYITNFKKNLYYSYVYLKNDSDSLLDRLFIPSIKEICEFLKVLIKLNYTKESLLFGSCLQFNSKTVFGSSVPGDQTFYCVDSDCNFNQINGSYIHKDIFFPIFFRLDQ